MGTLLHNFQNEKHVPATCVTLSSQILTVAVGYHDGKVRQFDVSTGKNFAIKLHLHICSTVHEYEDGVKSSLVDIISIVDDSFDHWHPSIAIQMEEVCGLKGGLVWFGSMAY